MMNDKPKWTPGRWTIRDRDHRTGTPFVGPENEDVATIHVCPGLDVAEANARLIAAAPEMAEALLALVAEAEHMHMDLRRIGRGRPTDGAHPDCPIERARTALRKARGED